MQAGDARIVSAHLLALEAPSMAPEDWAKATEAMLARDPRSYVHVTLRDVHKGTTQGPVRIKFEESPAAKVELQESFVVMGALETRGRCA